MAILTTGGVASLVPAVSAATVPVTANATQQVDTDQVVEPAHLTALPGDQVFPESIAIDQDTGVYYVGSVKDGTIYRGRVGSDDISIFSAAGADGRTNAHGLALDGHRLVVLSRQSAGGTITVYDTRTGTHLATLDNGLGATGTAFNDVTVGADGSYYVTDSANPTLYRITHVGDTDFKLTRFLDFSGTPLHYITASGAAGINVNGIVRSPDGRYLIVAKRNENALYRITLATKQVIKVNLPDGAIDTPDGIFLKGGTLYVAQNDPASVADLRFASDDYTAATVPEDISGDPAFLFPTAAAVYGDKLLVVNSQFNSAGSPAAVSGTNPPVLPFGVSTLELPMR